MSTHFIKRQKQLRKEISLIPLINIIFLLLIFFMVAGQVQQMETLEVTPPKSEEGKERRYLPIVVYIDKQSRIALNGNIVKKEDFLLLLETLLYKNDSGDVPAITIRADKDANASHLVWVMDEIKKAGGTDISIVTKEEN